MVTDVLLATTLVLTAKVAVVAFAATVTLEGTVAAAVLLLLSVTTAPPAGAGPVSVTVPVDEVPPITVVGFRLTELGTAAATVRLTLWVVLLNVAEMVTDVLLLTMLVVTVNVAVVVPPATVTLEGTVATAVLPLLSVTTAPALEGGLLSVTVAVEDVPPVTVGTVKDARIGAFTVIVVLCVVLLKVAEIVTDVLLDTGLVVTVNVAVLAPAATVTLAGT